MGEHSYILEQQGKSTAEKLAEFTAAIGWRDELATYRIAQDEYEMRAAAAAEQGISLLDEPPYTAEELAALDAESAAYYSAFAANYVATAAFSGSGSGTQSDPYIITNRAELVSMADDLTAYYQLANDIDLGGSGSPWTPIGSQSAPFGGTLDGNGHEIQNLVSSSGGIYGSVHSATIQNIGITGISINSSGNSNGDSKIGGIVGNIIDTATISRSFVQGSISATSTYNLLVGGICGSTQSGSAIITDCYADVTISLGNSDYVFGGGIVGTLQPNFESTISNTYTLGGISVSGSASNPQNWGLGGIGGFTASSWGSIGNSVSLMDTISGNSAYRVAGKLGVYLSSNYANVAMLVNGNTVSGGTTTNTNGADVSPSTYHTQTFWQNTLGWDFQDVWYWDDTANLPKLRAFLHGPTITSVSATPTTGGTTTQITLSATVQDATSYQWQYSTNGGSSWQNIPGATTIIATWTPGAVGTYQVRLLATNSDGTTISGPVTVTIYPDPTISDVTIYPNPSDESATFLISAAVNDS